MARNKQPWYHEGEILFTTTHGRVLAKHTIMKIQEAIESVRGVVKGSVEFIESEPEPGDPADLL